MSGRRDSESFWPASPATPPTPPTGPDGFWIARGIHEAIYDPDWPRHPVHFDDGIHEAIGEDIDADTNEAARHDAAQPRLPLGVKKRTKTIAVLKRPSAVTVTQTPLSVEKHPANSIMKRPASSTTSPVASASPAVSPSTLTVPIGDTFKGMLIKMNYSKTNAIGIRLRGGRQLMQVQCTGARAELIDHWANLCIKKLESGLAVDDVKDWLHTQKSLVMDVD